MKIGILSDVHGDMNSLQKALMFFERNAVDSMICAGDVVEKGDNDDGVVSRLRDLEILCVQGNHDENAIRHHELSGAVKVPGEVPLNRRPLSISSLCRALSSIASGKQISS